MIGPITCEDANALAPPRCCGRLLFQGNREALAWALDTVGRSVQWISVGAFLSTALLTVAKDIAGCDTTPAAQECEGRIFGLRPSSLLTSYSVVIGVLATLFMPVIGAIIDYTPHRLLVGRVLASISCALTIPTIFISSNEWVFLLLAIVQVLQGFVGWGLTLIKYSYLPELTDDKALLNKYVASFNAIQFGTMVLYLVIMIALFSCSGLSGDDIVSAQISQATASVVLVVMLFFAYARLFQPRPASHTLSEDRSILTAGFRQVFHTAKIIVERHRALKWFYIQNAFTDAMLESLAAVVITFFTDTLDFTSTDNGVVIMITLISSIPGSLVAGWLNDRFGNPIITTMMGLVLLVTTNVLGGVFLIGPDQRIGAYIVASGWGMGFGWTRSCNEMLSSTLIPKGQDAELMGMFLFTRTFLAWIPPLVFTLLNEAGVQQRWILVSLSIFFVFALGSCCMIGSFDDAVASVKEQDTATMNDEMAPIDVALSQEEGHTDVTTCTTGPLQTDIQCNP